MRSRSLTAFGTTILECRPDRSRGSGDRGTCLPLKDEATARDRTLGLRELGAVHAVHRESPLL